MNTMKWGLLICWFLLVNHSPRNNTSYKPWDPNAGLIPSYTEKAILTASSNQKNIQKILDGDQNTAWYSSPPLPTDYLKREDQNIMLPGPFKIDGSILEQHHAFHDGNLGTGTFVNPSNGKAFLKISFAQRQFINLLTIKMNANANVTVHFESFQQKPLASQQLTSRDNYQIKRFDLGQDIRSITLESTKGFQVFEMGALASNPKEWVIIDFQESVDFGVLESKHWPGDANVEKIQFYVSSDKKDWQAVGELSPQNVQMVKTEISPEKQTRYLKIEYELKSKDWNKAQLWEVAAFDKNGIYGPMPFAQPSVVNIKQLCGVNGLWGWGHGKYSHLLGPREGPELFKPISSHARCYHDMKWMVRDPDNLPDYARMSAGKGTEMESWLNWDLEYKEWVKSGLMIQSTIQIHRFADKEWDNPYQSAYNYGLAFAKHFGPTYGNGYVCTAEVGNEPWKYEAAIYREILKGMSKGMKDGDPAIEVFPCALQATDPSTENTTIFKNYMGARLPKEASPYIDGINIHAYSYTDQLFGGRKAVHPEHKNSTFREILNAIRFRDTNMPGKKIYLSEWGWDSAGGGEDCTHDVCVSEEVGAIYGVRAALMSLRLGIDRVSWYFFANVVGGSSLYARSGLTGSQSTKFEKKKVFHAMESLIKLAGSSYFLSVIREDSDAWVYLLGDQQGNPTHIVGWRPTDGENVKSISIEVPSNLKPLKAVKLDGSSSGGRPTITPSFRSNKMKMQINAVPTLVMLDN